MMFHLHSIVIVMTARTALALKVKKLDERAVLPTVSHAGEDLGYDVYALEDVEISPHSVHKIRTGIAASYQHERSVYDYRINLFGLLIRDRSSVALGGLFTVGGVVDAGYTGEIIVLVRNLSTAIVDIKAGQKIAQMIPTEVLTENGVEEVFDLAESDRMSKGFGSSG